MSVGSIAYFAGEIAAQKAAADVARMNRSLAIARIMAELSIQDGDTFQHNGNTFMVTRIGDGPPKLCVDCRWFRNAGFSTNQMCVVSHAHPRNLVVPESAGVLPEQFRASMVGRGCGPHARWFEPKRQPTVEDQFDATYSAPRKRRGLWERFIDSCIEGYRR